MVRMIFLIALAGLAFGQDSNDSACRSLVKCLSDAEDARKQCDQLKQSSPNPKPASADSEGCSNINAKADDLQNLQSQQRKQQQDCLSSSFAEATPVGDKKKQDQCKTAVSNYQQQSTAGVGAGSSAGTNTNAGSSAGTITNGGSSAGANTNVGTSAGTNVGTSAGTNATVRAKRQAPTNSTVPVSIAPNNNSVPPKETIPTETGKVNATNGREDKNAAAAQFRTCLQSAEAKQKLCRELNGCCSEVTPCEYKYQLSPLHDQIYQAQLDLFNLRRQCQKQRLQKGNGKLRPQLVANGTAAASVKGGNMGKKPKNNQ